MTAPEHWSAAWLGRPWVEGAHDCVDLVTAVLDAEFGRRIAAPPRAAGVRARDRQVAALARDHAARVVAPCEGDIALLRLAGRRVGAHHVGVWCAPRGVAHILHCMRGLGTVLHGVGSLRRPRARTWRGSTDGAADRADPSPPICGRTR